jgi:hypothetical protein
VNFDSPEQTNVVVLVPDLCQPEGIQFVGNVTMCKKELTAAGQEAVMAPAFGQQPKAKKKKSKDDAEEEPEAAPSKKGRTPVQNHGQGGCRPFPWTRGK